MTPIDPASVAATHRGALLDRCLTERGFAGADRLAQARPCRIAGMPQATGAWIDRETLDQQDGGIGKVGYEINFNRVFFQYQPPRPLHEIDAELAGVEQRILELLREVTE